MTQTLKRLLTVSLLGTVIAGGLVTTTASASLGATPAPATGATVPTGPSSPSATEGTPEAVAAPSEDRNANPAGTTPAASPATPPAPAPGAPATSPATPAAPAPAEPATTQVFKDVPANHVFAAEITWLNRQGISTGWADGTFRPEAHISREQMAAFLYRIAKTPEWGSGANLSLFRDILPGANFFREVTWLSATKVTTGWVDGTFRPAARVTREQMAAFLYRLAGQPAWNAPAATPFKDVPTSAPFYREITWLQSQGITTGWADGTFRPGVPILRDQMAAFLKRFTEKGLKATASAAAPTTNKVCTLKGGGCFQVTDRGLLVAASPTATLLAVDGSIGSMWRATGSENGHLGYPTAQMVCGLRDGGCTQTFQGGRASWSPAAGAGNVSGAILQFWAKHRYEAGSLGYPTAPMACDAGGCSQRFQGDTVKWDPTNGAYVGTLQPNFAAMSPVQIGQTLARQRGWSDAQWQCAYKVFNYESKWNPTASNRSSGAYGIPQALPGSKMAEFGGDWRTNPVPQILWGYRYMESRYGSACGAWNQIQSRGWY